MKEVRVILNESDMSFLRHFIKQYNENFQRGKIEDSRHDAVAVILHLQGLLMPEDDE